MRMSDKQITLGQLIDALDKVPPSTRVYYDWCRVAPASLNSYRGYYEDLALGYDCRRGAACEAGELLKECRGVVNSYLEGYKGGNFRMTRKTPVWCANYGSATGWGVVGIVVDEYSVTLKTALIDP